MKSKFSVLIRLIVLMGFLFSLTGGMTKKVQAATCTWKGDSGVNWAEPGNWSCGHVPTESDDVIIPDVLVTPIINALTTGVDVNSISIESGGVLTINAKQSSLSIYTSSSFTNNGEIVINGVNDGKYGLGIYSHSFANKGSVTINTGYLSLISGGTHSGSFVGEPGTVLSFSNQWPDQTWNFTADSLIKVPIISVNDGSILNILGEFSPGLVLDDDSCLSIYSATINLNTNDVLMPVEVSTYGTLNLPDIALDIQDLGVGYGGQLHNTQTLHIINSLELKGGTLSGAGDVVVPNTANSFSIRGGTISGKELSNNATANWNTGNLTLLNNAVFKNSGTFNANATTTMTGTTPAAFINNGTFIKNTTGTTTMMNVPFTNNGSIEVNAGELIFQQGIQNGTNVEYNLGVGTLNPGETLSLASGDSLIGSGALSANLVNAGTVSPGSSPGTITVDGDYTQDPTGTLEIELGGTTVGTGYDQLNVNDTATLHGTLNVSLIEGFEPQTGDEFLILPYSSYSGEFTSRNLPEGYRWEFDYGLSGLTLTRLAGGTISGTVTCNSPHTVFVDLYVDNTTPPPEDSTHIACGDNYSFDDLPNGTYYVGAWIDLDESGDGPPDEGEPTAWYGEPTSVTIIDGETKADIDITIEGDDHTLFLPLILR